MSFLDNGMIERVILDTLYASVIVNNPIGDFRYRGCAKNNRVKVLEKRLGKRSLLNH